MKVEPQKKTQSQTAPAASPQTEEKLIHSMISDVFRITNESTTKSKTPSYSQKEQPKTFLYEFCKDGKLFTVEDLDTILYTRLSK